MKWFLCAFFFLNVWFLHSQDFKLLQAQAEKEYNHANFPKALELFEQAIMAVEKDKKATIDDLIDVKADYAVSLFYNDRMEDAIGLMGKLISETESNNVKPQTQITVHMNYGAILVSLGLYSNALPEFQKAYDLCKTNSYDKEDVVSIITTLAECNQYLYRFDDSEKLSKEAIAFCEKNGLTNTIVYASAYSGLATLYTDMMFEKKSVETYKITESIFVKNKDTLGPEFPVFLSNYGTLLANTYQPEQALSLLMRSKVLTVKLYGENSEEYAGCLNNIGFTYNQMGKLMETEQFYKKSLEIKRSLKRVRFDNYLTSVNNLQTFYSSAGRKAEAADLADELEKGMNGTRLQDTLKRMTFAENLADYYSRNKQYIKARKFLDESVLYTKSIYGDNNIELGNMYISIAILLKEQGNSAEATKYMARVPDVIKENSKGNLAESVSLIRNYAVTLSTRFGKYAEAEPFINESVKLVDQKIITNKNEIADIYFQKAQISSELNKIAVAIEYFNKYLDLKYSQIEEGFRYMTEAEKLQFLETFETETKNFFTSISNHVQKHPELINMLLNYRIQTKSMLLNNMSKIKKSIAQLNDPALNDAFAKLKLDRENISKLMSLNTDEYAAALSEVDALKREADQLEKEISAKVSQHNFSGYQKIQWKDIQKQLGPDECAVEVVRTNLIYQNDSAGTNYSFIILKNTGEPSLIMIDRPISWEDEILANYRNNINSKKDAPDLYRRLWKNISEKIGNARTVYVSADGIYNQVNLNTLFNPDSKKYLLEETDVHYVSTLKDIIEIKNNPMHVPSNVALVGNPIFNYDLTKLPENKDKFGDDIAVRGAFGFVLEQLPGTKTEIETIKAELDKNQVKATLLTEEKANESEVKKIKNPDVFHFATHGFFLEDVPEATLEELSKTEKNYYTNPMMRSGIFLSGANNTYSLNVTNIDHINEFEDGTLTAYEVMNLDLDKTELVVLSACETGLGKVKNGEGVFGLQRAFKLAGAKSVVMSLWSVSDEATMELMINFYKRWLSTGDLYKSFKEAQLDVKKKYPEPYYWGAFVLSGR